MFRSVVKDFSRFFNGVASRRVCGARWKEWKVYRGPVSLLSSPDQYLTHSAIPNPSSVLPRLPPRSGEQTLRRQGRRYTHMHATLLCTTILRNHAYICSTSCSKTSKNSQITRLDIIILSKTRVCLFFFLITYASCVLIYWILQSVLERD